MEEIIITEDQALAKGIDFMVWLKIHESQDWKIKDQYNHPAVGKVVKLIKE